LGYLEKLAESVYATGPALELPTQIAGRPRIGPTSQTLLFDIYRYLLFTGITVIAK
jgi:hypothetical protein